MKSFSFARPYRWVALHFIHPNVPSHWMFVVTTLVATATFLKTVCRAFFANPFLNSLVFLSNQAKTYEITAVVRGP